MMGNGGDHVLCMTVYIERLQLNLELWGWWLGLWPLLILLSVETFETQDFGFGLRLDNFNQK